MNWCVDDAASKAAREVMAPMASDSDMREKRLADGFKDVLKKSVNEVAAEISESLRGRMTSLDAKLQNQWETFEKTGEDKIVSWSQVPKRARLITMSLYHIRTSVHADLEKLCMEKEGKIMLNGRTPQLSVWVVKPLI